MAERPRRDPCCAWLRAVRQAHALEHATTHLLSAEGLDGLLVGHADWGGFTLYGPVTEERVARAARLALARLQAGEAALAYHPRCGTRLAMGGLLGALGLWAGWRSPGRSSIARVATALLAAAAGLLVARPLSPWVQRRWMTTPDLAGVSIVRVRGVPLGMAGGVNACRVELGR